MSDFSFTEYLEYRAIKLMGLLPLSWVSAIGAYLGERHVRKGIKAERLWSRRMRHNLQILSPDLDTAQQEQAMLAYGRQAGRIYTEFTVHKKIVDQGKLHVIGEEHLKDLNKPIIYVSAHMANWELVIYVASKAYVGEALYGLYEPRESKVRMQIAQESRHAWTQLKDTDVGRLKPMQISTESNAMLAMTRALKNGDNLLLLVDEERDGDVRSPQLNRNLPPRGNRWLVSRLAVKYDVHIVPIHVERVGNTNFNIVIDPPLELPDSQTTALQKQHYLAERIDQAVEKWVRKCPEHWYWLPNLDMGEAYTGK